MYQQNNSLLIFDNYILKNVFIYKLKKNVFFSDKNLIQITKKIPKITNRSFTSIFNSKTKNLILYKL